MLAALDHSQRLMGQLTDARDAAAALADEETSLKVQLIELTADSTTEQKTLNAVRKKIEENHRAQEAVRLDLDTLEQAAALARAAALPTAKEEWTAAVTGAADVLAEQVTKLSDQITGFLPVLDALREAWDRYLEANATWSKNFPGLGGKPEIPARPSKETRAAILRLLAIAGGLRWIRDKLL